MKNIINNSESARKEIIEKAEAYETKVEIDSTTLRIVNRSGEVVLYDFDKWEDIERIADILHLDMLDRQPVIIKQRAGAPAWEWETLGNTWEPLHFENNINPITGDEDHASFMKLSEDSTNYAIAIAIQK